MPDPPRHRPFVPSLPLPSRLLPWALLAVGIAATTAGLLGEDRAFALLGLTAVCGAAMKWTVDWLLGRDAPADDLPEG